MNQEDRCGNNNNSNLLPPYKVVPELCFESLDFKHVGRLNSSRCCFHIIFTTNALLGHLSLSRVYQ